MVGFLGHEIQSMRVVALGSMWTAKSAALQSSGEMLQTSEQWKFQVLRVGICTAVQKATLIELWNELPHGEQMRCHNPGFAIQVFHEGQPTFTAAVCWSCNNISMSGHLASLDWRNFDGSSQVARCLLELCRAVAESAASKRQDSEPG